MNEQNTPTDAELHAYADDRLDASGHARVSAYLAAHPDIAALVADWQAQNGALRATFAPHARAMPDDIALIAGTRASRTRASIGRPALAAAALLLFCAGAAGGYAVPRLFAAPQMSNISDILPTEARNAFLVYAGEKRHPVEVFADEEKHLAAWLGKRLAMTDLQVPDLNPLGFRLVGGRLLPVGGVPGAMFMYEDETGQRLTVLIGRNAQNRETGFRFASDKGIETFYWIDGEIGCAVSGEISRDMLRQIADAVYRQLPV